MKWRRWWADRRTREPHPGEIGKAERIRTAAMFPDKPELQRAIMEADVVVDAQDPYDDARTPVTDTPFEFNDIPIAKTQRLVSKSGERQNLVFGFANAPFPMAKAVKRKRRYGKSAPEATTTLAKNAPEGSLEAEIERIGVAYRAAFPDLDDEFSWVVATFPDKNEIIISVHFVGEGTTFFRLPFTDDDETITFQAGDAVELEEQFIEKTWLAKAEFRLEALADFRKRLGKEDRQGDRVDMAELETAAYNFVLTSREADVDHSAEVVGALVESVVLTTDKWQAMGFEEEIAKTMPQAWWVGFLVNDPTMDDVEAGKLNMFSIGGSAVREAIE